ncbi:MAG: hypothetical protein H6Q67_1833 [Firmicutes bacterium]|nr:hypothetical protein [Bacillota bacterium]
MGDRVVLSREEAISMLPEGDNIHTFRSKGFLLMGADWSRDKIIKSIDKYGCELSGEQATSMSHGIVLKDDVGYLFIETREGDGHG